MELANTRHGGFFCGDAKQKSIRALVPAIKGSVEEIAILKSTRQAYLGETLVNIKAGGTATEITHRRAKHW